ncbi:hypothetical protein ABW21_db0202375 [Orbilia brochopaga]|nr:hypothetical protein ABW21_db0202375 [Drechslerella brochopaga]
MDDDKPVASKLPGFIKDSLIGVLIALAAIALLVFTAVIIPKVVKHRQAQKRRSLQERAEDTDDKRSEEETVGILNHQQAGIDLEIWDGSSGDLTSCKRDWKDSVQLEVLEPELPLSSYFQSYLTNETTK